MADEAYVILSLKMFRRLGVAAGSWAVIFASSFRSWFTIGVD